MDPFLLQVAKEYKKNDSQNLMDFCFVFPNKRSGVFFSNYLSSIIESSTIMPRIITISDFIAEYSSGVEATRMELMFILYDEYRKLLIEKSAETQIVDFDKFQFWAEMLINDFNDVDKYLVDAKQLFVNIYKLKEINSNFLTDAQIEVINQYWNENRVYNESINSFWKHINHSDDKNILANKFIKLWQILFELYTSFKERLTNLGLCYAGMSYREVAETVKFNDIDMLSDKHYIFVGFNVLSTSEIKIFERLKQIGCADFYWDYNSPSYILKDNHASQFVGKYITKFKSLYPLQEEPIKSFPKINVIGIPSNIGQTKEASIIISELYQHGKITDVNTAVVLPDEHLFIPLLHSIPPEIKNINITMGYPMRHTPIAALIGDITSMHLRARIIHNKMHFFYEDILNVLSHPIIQNIASDECLKINQYINKNRAFNISSSFLIEQNPKLATIFKPVKDVRDTHEVIQYIRVLIYWIKTTLSNPNPVDVGFIDKYIDALDNLELLTNRYHIKMNDKTVFHLVERIVGNESVNFTGEPLKGLQIMGVLETRSLDFDNLIILSMNERIFPRKHYTKTFIPNALRSGYGMSTISYQESMYAYYFYRMLSRAKNVYIMYDARTSGVSSGEMSRYLYQLKFLYSSNDIKFSMINYDVTATNNNTLIIEKTPQIIQKLNIYKDPDSKKYLSASALNKYISCPLSFYLQYVEGLQQDDDITEYMDEGTYGTIMHEVAEKIYIGLKNEADEVLVSKNTLDFLKRRQGDIMKQITRSINKHYNKLGDKNDTPLQGDGKIIGEIMLHFTLLMLENEKQFTNFYFVDAEKKQYGQWKINEQHTINFKQIIDRIDKVYTDSLSEPILRFVDYKTGSDKVNLSTLESLFDKNQTDRRKAIFQLFTYCFYYAYTTGYDGDIQPYIYTYRTLNTEHLPPIKIAKKTLTSYKEYETEFWSLFENLINEIFDETIPFEPAKNDNACLYCKFTELCNKQPQ